VSSHIGGAGPPLAAPTYCVSTPELVFVPASSCDLVSMFYFRLYNPRIARGLHIAFSSCFCFELFLSGVDFSFEGTMAPSSDDKGKRPREEGPKLKEE
jgi:hypothetical protein